MRGELACHYIERLLPERMLNVSVHVPGNPDKAARIADFTRRKSNKKLIKLEQQINFAELERIQKRYLEKIPRNQELTPTKSPLRLESSNFKKPLVALDLSKRSMSVQKSDLWRSLSPVRKLDALQPIRSIEKLNKVIEQCKDFTRSYSKTSTSAVDKEKEHAFVPLKFLIDESHRSLTYQQPISLRNAIKLRKRENRDDDENFRSPLITERFRQDSLNLTSRVNRFRGRKTRTKKHTDSYTLLLMQVDRQLKECLEQDQEFR